MSVAFGVGIDETKTFQVLDTEVEIRRGDVVYITGDSGSGKSTLLREIMVQTTPELAKSIGGGEEPETGVPLVETVGTSSETAIELLNFVGLGDAFLYLRKYEQLSDGQKYRYRLALALDKGHDMLAFDEFCSVLDRTTAKVVAFLIQKICRKRGITLVVSTAHDDLLEDLVPDVYVRKGFGSAIKVAYNRERPRHLCTVGQTAVVEPGTMNDYKELAEFHYREGNPAFIRKIYRMRIGETLAGVVVYTPPASAAAGRSIAFPEHTEQRKNGHSEYLKYLNARFSRISRVVVHPTFRGIGLAARLLRETMPQMGYPYIEMLAAMGRFSKFAESAGMTFVPVPKTRTKRDDLHDYLKSLGCEMLRLHSRRYMVPFLKTLPLETFTKVQADIKKSFTFGGTRRYNQVEADTPEQVAEALRFLPVPILYYIWKNPDAKDYPDINLDGSRIPETAVKPIALKRVVQTTLRWE